MILLENFYYLLPLDHTPISPLHAQSPGWSRKRAGEVDPRVGKKESPPQRGRDRAKVMLPRLVQGSGVPVSETTCGVG